MHALLYVQARVCVGVSMRFSLTAMNKVQWTKRACA